MNIKTEYWAKPIPSRNCDWSAIDDDTYDAEYEDGRWRGGPIGYGATEQEAIDNLRELLDLCPVCDKPVECDCKPEDLLTKHKVTCTLFPDPFDERDPVGPCTCGAIASGNPHTVSCATLGSVPDAGAEPKP